ncbi:DMT family transporter [Corynebacterium sp. HS2168-gen11]|uniref:EamA family transporter n=1 Tax=Corynebacterium sp. HS2168-gen11 TaxID=2974027 RepID=UPI00216B058D|nr:EamA family transporter [Corynebacterium sp. HS2168-gen11]MCS4535915.1 EamA family transporter [Corynebacterium sp. HS2168-gen11]
MTFPRPRLHALAPRRPQFTRISESPFLGVCLVLAAVVSLQFGSAFATQLFPIVGTWATTFVRLFIAALVIVAISRPKIFQWTKVQWRYVLYLGISIGMMNAFFYAGLSRLNLATAVTIEFIGPLTLAAILSRNAKDFLWVLLAFIGILLFGFESIYSAASFDLIGVSCVLVAAVFWALYILASSKVGVHVPGVGGLGVAMIIGALPLLPFAAPELPTLFLNADLLLLAIGTSVMSSLVPYSLEFIALRILPSNTFGILMALEPVVAAIMGWILLSQPIGVLGAIAIVCVMSASIGTTRKAPKPKTRIEESEFS